MGRHFNSGNWENKNQPTEHMVHVLRQATWALGCRMGCVPRSWTKSCFLGWLVQFAGRDRDWLLCGSAPSGFSEAGCQNGKVVVAVAGLLPWWGVDP